MPLGLTPLVFGVIDGLYQGVAPVARLAAGVLADRGRRHKEVASFGYGLSALCRVALVLAGGAWTTIAGVVSLDRSGNGIRTAPREAMIWLRSPCSLATAFDVDRALDAFGAMLGPMVAFLVLAAMPGTFDVLFMASFGVSVIGCGVIAIFVDGSPAARKTVTVSSPSSSARGDAREWADEDRVYATLATAGEHISSKGTCGSARCACCGTGSNARRCRRTRRTLPHSTGTRVAANGAAPSDAEPPHA